MRITWQLTHQASPGSNEGPLPDFTALDSDEPIGRVYQFTEGAERGLWVWTLTASRPGPGSDAPTSGLATERGRAGVALVETYCSLVERSWHGRVKAG